MSDEVKERRRREKKATVVLLVFVLATLEIALGRKKNCLTEEKSGEMCKIVTGASDKKSVIEYNDLLSECHKTKCPRLLN